MHAENYTILREAVGVFDNKDQLDETIKDLRSSGFGRHEISIRGSEARMKEQFGRPFIEPEMVEDHPATPRSIFIVPEELGVAQGVLLGIGMLAGAALGLVATGYATESGSTAIVLLGVALGALAGSLLVWLMSAQYHRFFRQQEQNGGLVLWVKTDTDESTRKAQVILERHGAHDVHIHDLAVAA